MKYTHFQRQVFDRDKHTDITDLIHPLTSSEDKMEYKLIKKFLPELNIEQRDQLFSISSTTVATTPAEYIKASDLEAELTKGVEVFGNAEEVDNATFTTTEVDGQDTHSGLLLNYKPIETSKPVSREEIEKALSENAPEYQLEDLLKRILENGVK